LGQVELKLVSNLARELLAYYFAVAVFNTYVNESSLGIEKRDNGFE
jgi:hypothetical protein